MRGMMAIGVLLLAVAGCSDDLSGGAFASGEHLVSGGVSPDGIVSLNNPPRMAGSEMPSQDLAFDDHVLGVLVNGEAMAYPVKVMDWHEVANDVVGGVPLLLSYCPLTATGIGFDRRISAGTATFGVSGLLCDSNLVMFDRLTSSLWPQMGFESIRGDLTGEKLDVIHVIETKWERWRNLYPDTEVLDIAAMERGSAFSYDVYPYGTYYTSSRVSFPLRNPDARMHAKTRVHGVRINGEARAYQIADFPGVGAVNDSLGGEPVVLFGNATSDYGVSYLRKVDGESRTFEMTQSWPPRIRDLETGTIWDIHGTAVSGPDAGLQLGIPESFTGFWFAWASFRPDTDVWIPEP
jgi:hypothetical protein